MTMQVNFNEQFNGIEVSFDKKPSASVLTMLKYNGFRWHRVKQLWYAKDTSERRAMIEQLGCKTPKQTQEPKTIENIYGIKVGDIYILSFGYNMTLYSFFQVVSVTEKSCRVVEINERVVGGNAMTPQKQVECGVMHKAKERSIWVKDQQKGDVKFPKPGCRKGEVVLTFGNNWAHKYDGSVVEEDHWD